MPENWEEGMDDDEMDGDIGDEEGSGDDSEEDTMQAGSYEFAGDEDEEEYADDW